MVRPPARALALPLLLLAGAVPAVDWPQPAALPQGDTGLAARHPGDVGLAGDAAVIFADDFESEATVADLWGRWSNVYQQHLTTITTERADVFAGAHALQFRIPQGTVEVANSLEKRISPTVDTLFLRAYTKFSAGFDVVGSGHNGLWISSQYKGPGIKATGANHWLVLLENSRDLAAMPLPGSTNFYVYWPEQRDVWGDHWYPTGRVVPFDATPGNFGPNFVSRPEFVPQLERWYCYEVMVKANTPGVRDGRVALWIDGRLIADYPNVRLRDVASLTIDLAGITLHARDTSTREVRKWYDNVVMARSYIGPLVASGGTTTGGTTTGGTTTGGTTTGGTTTGGTTGGGTTSSSTTSGSSGGGSGGGHPMGCGSGAAAAAVAAAALSLRGRR